MKKALLFLFVCALGGALSAQTLQITQADSTVYGNATSSPDIYGYITVKNISNIDANYLVKRIDKNYNALTDSNAICWQTCFNPDVSVALFPLYIPAGQENNQFVGHVYPDGDGVPRSGAITYVFYKQFDESDSISFTMNYEVTANFSTVENKLPELKVYPNPAKDILHIELSRTRGQASEFELFDMVGHKLYSKKVTANANFDVDLKKLAKGVYFYTLKQNGKALITKKLVVK
jgi:hypothetical protein